MRDLFENGKKPEVSVIIPAYRPGIKFERLLKKIQKQSYPVKEIIVMNTEKKYWNMDWEFVNPNLKVYHIKKSEFDHGKTRAEAVKLSTGDIMVLFTQDAVPVDEFVIENLVKAFRNTKVGAAYGRQLPNSECALIERYTRAFNYPDKSRLKGKADLDELGIKTFFCSNVCAAYRKDLYMQMGGFITHTIFNEDMIYAGKIVLKGYLVAYQADARVFHSHNYGNVEQFKRNFDLAVSQADHPEIFGTVKSEKEGICLVKNTARYLCKIHKPWLVVDLVIKSGFKFLGYRTGKIYKRLPKKIILACTMNPSYWRK